MVPQWFFTASAVVLHCFRSGSSLLPQWFLTSSAVVPHFFRSGSAAVPQWFSAVAPQTRKQPRACACFVLLKTALIIFFTEPRADADVGRTRLARARASSPSLAVDRRVVVSSCHVAVSWYGGVALHARARCAVAACPAHLARRTYGDMALHARAQCAVAACPAHLARGVDAAPSRPCPRRASAATSPSRGAVK